MAPVARQSEQHRHRAKPFLRTRQRLLADQSSGFRERSAHRFRQKLRARRGSRFLRDRISISHLHRCERHAQRVKMSILREHRIRRRTRRRFVHHQTATAVRQTLFQVPLPIYRCPQEDSPHLMRTDPTRRLTRRQIGDSPSGRDLARRLKILRA